MNKAWFKGEIETDLAGFITDLKCRCSFGEARTNLANIILIFQLQKLGEYGS